MRSVGAEGLGGTGQPEIAEQHHRHRIAPAEGPELRQLLDSALGQFLHRRCAVGAEGGDQMFLAEARAGVGGEGLAEGVEVLAPQRQSRRRVVAAVAIEQMRAGREPAVQVIPVDAPARPLAKPGVAALVVQQDRRPMKLLHQPRADDPDHARVPLGVGQHDRPTIRAGHAGFLGHPLGLGRDRSFGPLPLLVDARQARGDLVRPRARRRRQQFHGLARVPEPAAGVEPRGEPEPHLLRVDGFPAQPRRLDESREAFEARVSQAGEPVPGDDPILSHQRHDIGDRSEGGQRQHVQQPFAHRGLDPISACRVASRGHCGESPREFEGDARSAEIAEGILGVGPPGVDDRKGLGNGAGAAWGAVIPGMERLFRPEIVVVGDDEIEAGLAGFEGRLEGGDAAVDRDDNPGALGGELDQGVAVQPVALIEPVGCVGRDHRLGVDAAQRVVEDGRRGDAVGVVVAVDDDRLASAEGVKESRRGAVEVREPRGVVQLRQSRLAEGPGGLRVRQSPRPQHAPCQRFKPPALLGRRPIREAFGVHGQPASRQASHQPSLPHGRLVRGSFQWLPSPARSR